MVELSLKPQARRIIRHIQRGKSITPLEALGVYGVFRLAAVIYDIKKAGFGQLDRTQTLGTPLLLGTSIVADTNGKRYAPDTFCGVPVCSRETSQSVTSSTTNPVPPADPATT
jgi:hypothetical protein